MRLVAPSYYQQEGVDEVIFVDDAGSDDTLEVIQGLSAAHAHIRTRVIRNGVRLGAAGSRNVGVAEARNDYILFCDDDEYLLPGYASSCLSKLEAYGAGAVSGRNVYMLEGETPEAAVERFGVGLRRVKPFNYLLAERVNAAVHVDDIAVPYTHSIIVTRRSDLLEEPFDPFYSRGNGYREESDYQMRLFLKGRTIYVTNDAYCAHLPPSLVRTGGQRTSLFARLYWSIYYTRYFYGKYYVAYAKRVGLSAPRSLALAAFVIFALYRETVRPVLRTAVMTVLKHGAR